MGRKREFAITWIKKHMKGFFSLNKQDCVAEVYGKVEKSGSTYISKDLIGYNTVTYVLKGDEEIEVDTQENSTGTDSTVESGNSD